MSSESPRKTRPEETDHLAIRTPEGEQSTVPRQLGDFRIIDEIAAGGMAIVYEAEQISVKRRVALKILPRGMGLSGMAVKRFRREAEACGRQNHPGIVSVFAVGEKEGVRYIATELVPGGRTLSHWIGELKSGGTLPVGYFRNVTQAVLEVASALAHAHERKVIHRDIKPSNILITAEGRSKVTDFGLARVEDARPITRAGDMAGTPFYMSPEQAKSEQLAIDARTDVYSLGVTLYEMLTLKRPFEGKTSQEVIRQIISHDPRDPRKVNSRVPRDLAVICLKAMEKKPEDRYGDMAAFGADLKSFLDGEVIAARPVSPATRAIRRIRRNPVASVAAAVVIAALLLLGANMLWTQLRILSEKQKACEVNGFLVSLLSAPDPDGHGKDVKVADILERAESELEERFGDRRDVRAALQRTIGLSYEALGDHAGAERLLGAALGISRDLRGPDDRETLDLEESHGVALMELGRFEEARAAFTHVLEIRKDDEGPEARETLSAASHLAAALWHTDDRDGAEKLFREVCETRRRILPPDHEGVLRSMNDLGSFLLRARDETVLDEAEELLRAACAGRRETLGITKTATLLSMNNLAALLERRGRLDEARELYEAAVAEQEAILPPDHSDLLATRLNLSMIVAAQGDHARAFRIQHEVFSLRTASLGESHPDTLSAKNSLALTLGDRGEPDESLRLLEEIAEQVRLHPETRYSDRHIWTFNLADACLRRKDFARAVPLFKDVLDAKSLRPGEPGSDELDLVNRYSNALLGLGDYEESERLILLGIDIADKILPGDHPRRIALHDRYSLCLHRMERTGEAIDQLRICYESKAETDRAAARRYLELALQLCRGAGLRDRELEYQRLLIRMREQDER